MELKHEADLMTSVIAGVTDVSQIFPPTSTEPVVGESMSANRCSSVDFPQPDGPVMATISP